jgi:outer membrane protein
VRGFLRAVVPGLLFLAIADAETSSEQTLRDLSLIDAVRSALTLHPLLRLQEQQVAFNRGVKQQFAGQFDPSYASSFAQTRANMPLTAFQQQQAAAAGVVISAVPSNQTSFQASYQQLFRSGIVISPSFEIAHIGDPLQNSTGTNTTRLGFQITVPLLRGRGREVVAAQETAAGVEVEASSLDLSQQIANLMDQTAENYWNLKAAELAYQVAVSSEERGQVFVDNVRTLITADKMPRAELYQVLANLAERTTTRLAALQQVVSARQQLRLSMGVTYEQLASTDSTLADDLPDGENQVMPGDSPADIEYYLGQAIANRADVLAALRRREEARVLSIASHNLIKSTLNLSLSTGYIGIREGGRPDQFVFSLGGLHGPDASAAVAYSFPSRRNAAIGQIVQADATVRQSEFKANETQRQVSTGVIVALEGIRNSIERLKRARQSVGYYQLALEDERDKWRLGIGSLINILTMEDRLTGAMNNDVIAKLSYAVALSQFRLATGTLMAPDKPVQNIEMSTFVTLPFVGNPGVAKQ